MSFDIRQNHLKTSIEEFLLFAQKKDSDDPAQMALELEISKLSEKDRVSFFTELKAIARNPSDAAKLVGKIPLKILIVSPELRDINKTINELAAC